MIEHKYIEHHIQKHILAFLMEQKYARFRDMRPPKTDTNLYSYHLKLLQKSNFVDKTAEGYTLTKRGMSYVDRINADTVILSLQPKVVTTLVIQDENGNTLMYEKLRQPFIEQWTLPFGKVHNDDASILEAAKREAKEKIGDNNISFSHVGDCYIRVRHDDGVKISSLVHVFYGVADKSIETDQLKWIPPRDIPQLETAPAIDQIIARTFFKDPYFFEEFTVDW